MVWECIAAAWVLYIWMGAFCLGVSVSVWQGKDGANPPLRVMFICFFGWPFLLCLGGRK